MLVKYETEKIRLPSVQQETCANGNGFDQSGKSDNQKENGHVTGRLGHDWIFWLRKNCTISTYIT